MKFKANVKITFGEYGETYINGKYVDDFFRSVTIGESGKYEIKIKRIEKEREAE